MHERFTCKTRLYKATTFFCFLRWLTGSSDRQLLFTPVRGPTKKLELQRRRVGNAGSNVIGLTDNHRLTILILKVSWKNYRQFDTKLHLQRSEVEEYQWKKMCPLVQNTDTSFTNIMYSQFKS